MKEVYACIWRATEPDETFNPEEFQSRIPRLMEWLKKLKQVDTSLDGGGGFSTHAAGLTFILAEISGRGTTSSGTPMNEIGSTDVMLWDVFYADLSVL